MVSIGHYYTTTQRYKPFSDVAWTAQLHTTTQLESNQWHTTPQRPYTTKRHTVCHSKRLFRGARSSVTAIYGLRSVAGQQQVYGLPTCPKSHIFVGLM
jgi:hypothetical protein